MVFLWSVWCSKFSPFCPHLFVQDRCHLSTQWCKRSWFCLYESAVRHKTFIGSGSTRTEASVVINNGWKETTCKMWAAGNWQRWINNKDSEVCFMDTDNQWCESKWFLINAQIYNMRLLLKLLPTETNQAKKKSALKNLVLCSRCKGYKLHQRSTEQITHLCGF